MTSPDIPTPETDAHFAKPPVITTKAWIDARDFARDLERRLAAATAEVKLTAIRCSNLEEALSAIMPSDELTELVASLRSELAAATARAEEAERWKSEALQVEREWDPQELAKMLGGALGESCRMVVQREVPRLLSELDRLRKEREWQPIDELNKSEMQFVLVYQDGAMRASLWNPRGYWETPMVVGEPTHWMPPPDAPKQEEGEA